MASVFGIKFFYESLTVYCFDIAVKTFLLEEILSIRLGSYFGYIVKVLAWHETFPSWISR